MSSAPETRSRGLDDLIYPELWQKVLPAIRELRNIGEPLHQQGRYFARQDSPHESYSDSGWPLFSVWNSILSQSAPIDWRQAFSDEEGQNLTITLSQLPKMQELYAFVEERIKTDQRFRNGISLLGLAGEDTDFKRIGIRIGIRSFIGKLINRAVALEITSTAAYLCLYQDLEIAHFSSKLKGDVVLPLVLVKFNVDDPFQIADDVWLEPLSREDNFSRAMPSDQQVGDVHYLVAAAATHALVVRSIETDNFLQNWDLRNQALFEDELHIAEQMARSLLVVTGFQTGIGQILLRPTNWAYEWVGELPALQKVRQVRSYPRHMDEGGWLDTPNEVSGGSLHQIVDTYRKISDAPKSVQLAVTRLWRSTKRSSFEDKVIDTAVGIEALLSGQNEQGELTHRLAQRASYILADKSSPVAIYRVVREFYKFRSKLVHGVDIPSDSIKLQGQEVSASEIGYLILQDLLRNWTSAQWKADELDEKILRAMKPTTQSDSE